MEKSNPKLWLCGMSGISKEDYENLQELISPIIKYFDGLVWTLNYNSISDLEKMLHEDAFFDEQLPYEFLQKNKKDGKIILNQWNFRNDFCRNSALFSGAMKNGDYFILLDNLERLKPSFFKLLPQLIIFLETSNIEGLVLHGKRFLYRYHDWLKFVSNPHEGLYGSTRIFELTNLPEFKDSSLYFENVRPLKREKFHFIDAFMRYYLSYPDSNHCILGYENNKEEYVRRETLRQQFRAYIQNLGLECLVPVFKEYLLKNKDNLSQELKNFINNEIILNDFYRYYILEHRNISGSVYPDENFVKI